MTCCCSNYSMSISASYDSKGKMFIFILYGKPFRFTSQYITISKTFRFVPVANCTSQGFSCLTLPSLHKSTILGDTQLRQASGLIKLKQKCLKPYLLFRPQYLNDIPVYHPRLPKFLVCQLCPIPVVLLVDYARLHQSCFYNLLHNGSLGISIIGFASRQHWLPHLLLVCWNLVLVNLALYLSC